MVIISISINIVALSHNRGCPSNDHWILYLQQAPAKTTAKANRSWPMPCCIAYHWPRQSPSTPPSVARNTQEGPSKGNGKGKQREDAAVTGNEGQVAELRAQLDCNIDTVHHKSSALRVDFETHCMDVMSQCTERVTSHYSGRGLSTGKLPRR
jgi:hypothetical protein